MRFLKSFFIAFIISFATQSLANDFHCVAKDGYSVKGDSLIAVSAGTVLRFNDKNGSFLLGNYAGEKTELHGGILNLNILQKLSNNNQLVAFWQKTSNTYTGETLIRIKNEGETLVFSFFDDDLILTGICGIRKEHQKSIDLFNILERKVEGKVK